MGLKLEVGKYYKTRDGRKVGPMKNNWSTSGHFCWCVDAGCCSSVLWDEVGCSGSYCDYDLIAEWPADDTPTGPVRTVTRKEVVPGVYDGLDVGQAVDGHVFIAMGIHRVDAEAIDALIAHLTVIRDALEDV